VTSDWVALTRLTLNTGSISYPDQSSSDGFHTGMVIRLSNQDRFYWGLYQTQGNTTVLRLEKDNLFPAEVAQVSGAANATVTLGVHYSYAKGQCNYTFGYQFPNASFTPLTDGNGKTVTLSDCTRDTTTTGAGAAGIGLITKTFNNGVALTTDFDWFDLITSSAVSEVLGGLNASENRTTCASTASPVNCATGDFYHQFDDLSIPGRGISLHFARTYNALASAQTGRLGYGWTDSYNLFLTADSAGDIVVTQEDGSTVPFFAVNGVYQAPPRVLATLVANGDGTLTFTRKNQQKFTFLAPATGAVGPLLSESDRNGYTTSLTYTTPLTNDLVSKITDPSGRSLTFGYDGANHIKTVSDSIGRTVAFTYNAAGELIDAQDVRGYTTHFTYTTANNMHLLQTIWSLD